ncbi:hypothetical protein [Sinomonas gamaensis]|uniref:hypothetical protein n=1 Tax=Sinomonas gamaensis TaxID=2565624 RepID=UPI0011087365|nr:hypothetical protein [Sinomonas gamaensis]
MEGPSEELRTRVASEVRPLVDGMRPDVVDASGEEALTGTLEMVSSSCSEDVRTDRSVATGARELSASEAEDLLAAVHAWAALASYAAARIYGPNSPMRGGLAGWSKRVAGVLQKIAGILLTPLKLAAQSLRASSWSIGVNFPWAGVAVSLTWP